MNGTKKITTSADLIIPVSRLLGAYSKDTFPMARYRKDEKVFWYTALRRGIIPIGKFHVPRRVRRIIRRQEYEWAINLDFKGVIEACADREVTWISEKIQASYVRLHDEGHAHSLEIYQKNHLAGGIYGVSLGSAFFAESMFEREPGMAKIALYHCHEHLSSRGFRLWDVQFFTHHLAQFGCVEIDSAVYEELLEEALKTTVCFK